MDHQEAGDLLSEYRDGELSPDQSRGIAAHLESCADCRRALAGFERLGAALFAPPAPPDPEAFTRAVMARVSAPEPELAVTEDSWTRSWAVPAFGFVVAALLLAMLFPKADMPVFPDEVAQSQSDQRLASASFSGSAAAEDLPPQVEP